MRILAMILVLVGTSQAFALAALKCSTEDRKTLWASFARTISSGETEFSYYPVDLTVLNGPESLQARILVWDLQEGLKLKIRLTESFIGFDFPTNVEEGVQMEGIKVLRYQSKDRNSYIGTWVTTKADGEKIYRQAFCTAYYIDKE